MNFLPVAYDSKRLSDYQKLLSLCFSSTNKFSIGYLNWLYCLNPDGYAVGFDAYQDGALVAHYACIPGQAKVNGLLIRCLLSLNTATHPNYQGKGLFTKLANLTYLAAADLGYDSVYGVANQNSTPGFIRKLGFQLVTPLDAKIGIQPLGLEFPLAKVTQFQRAWSSAALSWRCSSPANSLSLRVKNKMVQITGSAGFRGALSVIAEAEIAQDGTTTVATEPMARHSPLKLFLGCLPVGHKFPSTYMSIPQCLRPSPLNLIYLPLKNTQQTLCQSACFMNFIDFDAY